MRENSGRHDGLPAEAERNSPADRNSFIRNLRVPLICIAVGVAVFYCSERSIGALFNSDWSASGFGALETIASTSFRSLWASATGSVPTAENSAIRANATPSQTTKAVADSNAPSGTVVQSFSSKESRAISQSNVIQQSANVATAAPGSKTPVANGPSLLAGTTAPSANRIDPLPNTANPATWNGGDYGASHNWTDTGNWSGFNANPDGSGTTIIHFAGTVGPNPFNDYGAYTQFNQILFDSGSTSFTLDGAAIKLAPNGATVAKIENNSTSLQTVNFNTSGQSIGFVGSATANMELDPTIGDLTIFQDIFVDNPGSVIHVFGDGGHVLTLNGNLTNGGATAALSIEGGILATSPGSTVVLRANNSYTGDTQVNAGILQFGISSSNVGSANGSVIRLGTTTASSASNARISLATWTGGQTMGSILNPRGPTTGTESLDAQNISGTDTLSNHIGMDHAFRISESPGGTLNITQAHTDGATAATGTDIKAQTLTLSVAAGGTINYSGDIYNSTGAGTPAVVESGGGTLTLSGANTYGGALTINGGTVSVTAAGAIASTDNIVNQAGTFGVVGSAAGTTTYNVGTVTNNAGVDTISVATNGGGGTTLNITSKPGPTPSVRDTTFSSINYVGNGGALGSAGGPKITYSLTPNLGAGNLLSSTNSATSATIGFATVTDTNGKTFATYNANGVVAAAATKTVTDATGLGTGTTSDFVQFNAPTGTTTAAGTVVAPALRITPSSGATLAMGANNITSSAIMLDGTNDFILSGTGIALNTASTHYLYVNNASTTLTTSMVLGNSGNPTDIVGPGFVVLNGSASQIGVTTTNRLNLLGGVLRGNNTQLGFTSAGAGTIDFRGGVLEITGGANGSGATADFTRAINATATAGTINWQSTSSGDANGGSGGFSAFGSAASVNIGGNASPSTLTWGVAASGFIQDGYALLFGSTKSDSLINFQNNLALDSGAVALPYNAREVRVTAGVAGSSARLSGVISGTNSTDLLKTGTGILELTNANTYAGRTIVNAGTLLVNNTSGSGTGTGAVIVSNSGTMLGGSGTISGPVTVNSGANLSPGNSPGILHTGALTLASGSNFLVELNNTTVGSGYDQVSITGSGSINLSNLVITAANSGLNVNDKFFIMLDNTGNTITGNFAQGATVTASNNGDVFSINYADNGDSGPLANDISLTLIAIPEPSTWVAAAFAAAVIGWQLMGFRRRRTRA